MPTKVETLAAAIRGTMPPEPSALPPLVDPALRLYSDSMAAALLGPLPAPATPPGVPGTLTASYPTPVVPAGPGPHLAAASHGTLPSPGDSVVCQIHIDGSGNAWVFTGAMWRKLKYDP